jgi:transcriptional regulator with XRE-family HTH domain
MALGYVPVSMRDVGRAASVDHAQISRIANGKKNPTIETMERLRRYFTSEHGLRFESRDGVVLVGVPDE